MIEKNSVSLIKMGSIASGIWAADLILKTEVELMISRTICSGKYMTLIARNVTAVPSTVKAGAHIITTKGLRVNKVVTVSPRQEL